MSLPARLMIFDPGPSKAVTAEFRDLCPCVYSCGYFLQLDMIYLIMQQFIGPSFLKPDNLFLFALHPLWRSHRGSLLSLQKFSCTLHCPLLFYSSVGWECTRNHWLVTATMSCRWTLISRGNYLSVSAVRIYNWFFIAFLFWLLGITELGLCLFNFLSSQVYLSLIIGSILIQFLICLRRFGLSEVIGG